MAKIGIYATFLSEEQKQKIKKIASAYGYSIAYFKDTNEAAAGIADCEILYGYYPASLLPQAEKLRWLATASAGVDSYLEDCVYAHPDQVIVTNSAGSYGVTISEHMIMVILMLMRRMPEYTEVVRQRRWENIGAVRSILGSRFTIVGMGDIGTQLARRLKALGAAHITGVRRSLSKPADPAFQQVVTLDQLPQVIQDIDVLALCVPSTRETKGLLSREIIAQLSPKTLIVNVGRGSAIDQEALIEALNAERLAGAALDVMTPEPLPPDHPLYQAKNVLLTPHISGNMSLGYTCEVNVDMFCRNLVRYLEGEPLHHVVNRTIGY